MEKWMLAVVSVAVSAALAFIFLYRRGRTRSRQLPPGPLPIPLLGNLLLIRRFAGNVEALLRDLRPKYGPIITLHFGSRPTIFIADRHLAHRALVEHGVVFAHRPKQLENFLTITGTTFGPIWRLLRRNLVAETLHPSRVKIYAPARSWALGLLKQKLRESDGDIIESLQFAMFALLVFMCFGEKLGESEIRAIAKSQRDALLYLRKLEVFSFLPWLTRLVFRNRLETMRAFRRKRADLYLPIVRSRREMKRGMDGEGCGSEKQLARCYVDALLDLTLPGENGERNLRDDEMMALFSEFLNAGTDTTATELEWILAELVANPSVQEKLYREIVAVSGGDGEIDEEKLNEMPYLKAVVMEGLRRHPPAHFLLPHCAAEDTEIGGYLIPKGATVNVMVAEIGWDGTVWDRAKEFRPERFLDSAGSAGVDVTGGKEIKMMPFGVGRRICAGVNVAMLHLEYFVANLVKEFEWKQHVGGEEVDMTEKMEFTFVMKNPLKARLVPRETSR